ncbi:hypothetical protein FNYG_04271 [Fusarium nygamai]|uniref:Uncharacterized protein n=1 Tax=Gibberella nygamai TaxID=42673 RepID=A0A2K0WJV2_GIBNY|nr:hypothetical protein FNYG_04271 [Fusarium nygamai]
METVETSQYSIDLEELVADDELDELHLDIIDEFDRALNTRDRTLDQSTEGQPLDAEADKLADKLDDLW